MLLSDVDIDTALASGFLKIDPFDRNHLQPASYDLTVGDEAVTTEGTINVRERGYVRVSRGASAIIATREKLALSTDVAAHFGLRSRFARQGLILLSGLQVDPGFEGILSVTVFNSGVEDISLLLEEEFATIEFSYLRTRASVGYAGSYQGQPVIPSDEKRRLGESKAKSAAQIEQTLDSIKIKVDVMLSVVVQFLVGVLFGGVVGGLIGFFIARAVD